MAAMYHLLLPQGKCSELDTKKICDLHQVMKKHTQPIEETSFEGLHRGKPSDFRLLEEVRKRRQQRL